MIVLSCSFVGILLLAIIYRAFLSTAEKATKSDGTAGQTVANPARATYLDTAIALHQKKKDKADTAAGSYGDGGGGWGGDGGGGCGGGD